MGLRVGVIGTGFGAKVHVPVLQKHPDYDLVALCSVRPGRAVELAGQVGVEHAYDDWRKMIREQSLDMVVIASEPALHKEIMHAALSMGCHALCEKPPALNESEAKRMQESVLQSGKVGSMNFEWRYLPERQKMKEFIQTGVLGEIFHVNWTAVWPMWPAIRDRDDSWLWQSNRGGGFLGAIGSHMIDALHFWLGPLTAVHGLVTNHVPERRSGSEMVAATADDSFMFHGRSVHGTTFSVQFNVGTVLREEEIEFIGSAGTARIQGKRVVLATQEKKEFQLVQLTKPRDASGFNPSIQGYIHPQWELYSDFARAVQGQRPESLPTMEDVVVVQQLLDRIREDG